MILLQVLNLPFLVDKLALAIFHILLGDDPVVVDFLSLLLEEGHQFFLFLHRLLQLAKLLADGELVLLRLRILNVLGLVDSILLQLSITIGCTRQHRLGFGGFVARLGWHPTKKL